MVNHDININQHKIILSPLNAPDLLCLH